MSEKLIHFDVFSLDTEERVLVRDGRVVPLPAKALSTLIVLVRNNGHVVEKDALMKEVWPDEYVEEGNLAQHIYILRRALGESTESPKYIETIPRRGYRFMAEIVGRQKAEDVREVNSVAVLSFVTDGDPTIECLSDGLTDSLTNLLSQNPRLKVMARSIVIHYDGREPRVAGHNLGVKFVVSGFIKQLGENIVVSAELIDVADGSRIWGDHYSRRVADLVASQDELAQEISERILFRLNKDQKAQSKSLEQKREANEFYLKGRYAWSKRAIEDLKRGVKYFRQVLAEDPNYTLANAGIADCLLLLGLFGSEKPRDVMPQAKEFAERAIRLDATLGEAYASLGQIKLLYDWDFAGAEADFQKSIRLCPKYATAHQWYGEYLSLIGLFDQGLAELRKARDLDPLSLIINTNIGLNLYFARRYDLAEKQLERALELEPNFFRAHLHLGMVYERKLMYRQAIAELEKARSISENSWTLAALGHCHASFGAKGKAEQFLERLFALSRRQFVSCMPIAVVYAGFEDKADQTFEWLEKGFEERSGLLIWLNVWPIFDRLRADERFAGLLTRLGFSTTNGHRHLSLARQSVRLIHQRPQQQESPRFVSRRRKFSP